MAAADARGRVEALWTKRAHRGPMDARGEITLVAGEGVSSSVGRSRRRQVTIVAREAWDAACAQLGAVTDPAARRANVLVSGVDLFDTRGRVLAIGACRLQIGGETTPCERMDEAEPGLQEALRPAWRAGAFAQVLTGGVVRLGDEVRWVSAPSD